MFTSRSGRACFCGLGALFVGVTSSTDPAWGSMSATRSLGSFPRKALSEYVWSSFQRYSVILVFVVVVFSLVPDPRRLPMRLDDCVVVTVLPVSSHRVCSLMKVQFCCAEKRSVTARSLAHSRSTPCDSALAPSRVSTLVAAWRELLRTLSASWNLSSYLCPTPSASTGFRLFSRTVPSSSMALSTRCLKADSLKVDMVPRPLPFQLWEHARRSGRRLSGSALSQLGSSATLSLLLPLSGLSSSH
mmetsp:Transcript_4080/g.10160  ORF Transcript_4080/g.10160 Transcript_4080/m.10160 type:complete len:245 (-) Transcript_4080:1-735(-)